MSLYIAHANEASHQEFDFGDNVDVGTFEQILDMDEGEEDDGHEFSRSIVFGFLEQAETTFVKMERALYVTPTFADLNLRQDVRHTS